MIAIGRIALGRAVDRTGESLLLDFEPPFRLTVPNPPYAFVREGGFEPPRPKTPAPKAGASANSATLAPSRICLSP